MRVERYIALSVPVPPATVTHNKPNHRSDRLIKSYLEDANGGIPARIKGGDLDGLNNGKLDGVSDDSPINLDSPEQKDNQGKDGIMTDTSVRYDVTMQPSRGITVLTTIGAGTTTPAITVDKNKGKNKTAEEQRASANTLVKAFAGKSVKE